MSDYFTDTALASDFTRARASQLEALDSKTAAAFEMLPAVAVLKQLLQPAILAGGTADALTLTNAYPITAYALGQLIRFKAAATNSGAATINVDGLGVKSILRPSGAALIAGDLAIGRIYEAAYDGTSFQLIGTLIAPGTGDLGAAVAAAQAAQAAAELAETHAETAEAGAAAAVATALTNPAITGTILEDVYTIVDAAGYAFNPNDGSIQLWTLTASRTPTLHANFVDGKSITLMIADGTAFAVTWTTIGVVWAGGSAPTLPTSGYAIVTLWKVGGVTYGKYGGAVA